MCHLRITFADYTSQSAVKLYGWEVQADMAHPTYG